MKARIPNSAKLTKKQLQAAESYSRQVVKADQERLLRQYFKLMCYVLNRNFGFGSKRCLGYNKIIEKCTRFIDLLS